jgi:small-conductance mechanosensitive channel
MADSDRIYNQFVFVNNLFIGLATGVTTFLVHLAFSKDYVFSNSLEKYIILIAAILNFVSLGLGVFLAWRLVKHFRLLSRHSTVKIEGNDSKPLISSERMNRRLLRWQGVILFLGSLFLFILLMIGFISKHIVSAA